MRVKINDEQLRVHDEFIEKLVERRMDLGISQRTLEAKTGLPQKTITEFENKKRNITLPNLIKYTLGLGIDLSRVLENLI